MAWWDSLLDTGAGLLPGGGLIKTGLGFGIGYLADKIQEGSPLYGGGSAQSQASLDFMGKALEKQRASELAYKKDIRMNDMGTMGEGAATQARQAMDKFQTPVSTQVDANALREGGRAAIEAAGYRSDIAKAITTQNQKNMQEQIQAQLGSFQGASPAAIASIATKIGEGSSNSDYLQQSANFYNDANKSNMAAIEGAANTETMGTNAAFQRQVAPYLVKPGSGSLGNIGSSALSVAAGRPDTALGNIAAKFGSGLAELGGYQLIFGNRKGTKPTDKNPYAGQNQLPPNNLGSMPPNNLGSMPPNNLGSMPPSNNENPDLTRGGWRLNSLTGQYEQVGGWTW